MAISGLSPAGYIKAQPEADQNQYQRVDPIKRLGAPEHQQGQDDQTYSHDPEAVFNTHRSLL